MVLGLHLGSALGGFAAEGSKYMDDERKRANKLIDDAMDKWETKGSANWNTHVANKKATRKLARALKPYLSVDQIGVALEQGRGEEVLAEIRKYENMGDDVKALAGYKGVENIVNMGENYESSGMTMDEMINSVVGKVSGGMTLSDAFADTGQSKETTFNRLFNPNMNKMAKKRIEAIESISGKGSVANLRNYATGTVSSTDLPFSGTINLAKGLEEKKLKDALKTDGMPRNFTTVSNYLTKQLTPLISGTTIREGSLMFVSPEAQKKEKAGVLAHMQGHIATKLKDLGVGAGQDITLEQQEEIRKGLAGELGKFREAKVDKSNKTVAQTITSLELQATAQKLIGKKQADWLLNYENALIKQGVPKAQATKDATNKFRELTKKKSKTADPVNQKFLDRIKRYEDRTKKD